MTHLKAAILIVNGGDGPRANRWIRLCLERVAALTTYPNYRIYIWNHRSDDRVLEDWLLAQPRVTLLSAASYETFKPVKHPHRTPLQRLYHLARQEGAHYVVALDSDAHPLRTGWLTELLEELDSGAAVAGIWRDGMAPAIRPHIHASCLCTTVDFVERYQLRFDFDNTHAQETIDTISHFTWVAEANGLPVYRLLRTNRRQYHEWMGGIYGDLIYHHVAGSRSHFVFWKTPARGREQGGHNKRLRDRAAELLFRDYDAYIGWLQGKDVAPGVAAHMAELQATEQGRNQALATEQAPSPPATLPPSSFGQRARRRLGAMLQRSEWGRRALDLLRKRGRQRRGPVHAGEQAAYQHLFMPFRREHLAPLPAQGWTTHPPDFVGIGAPKCGTTWWYQLMLEHPQIVDNRAGCKELNYFLHFQHHALPAAEIALYREAFATPPGAVCGEFSTQYLVYPACLEHLVLAAPETQIIVILRNPIDRFISHLNQLVTKRGRRLFADLDEKSRYTLQTYGFYTEAILPSLYSIGLARLFHYFDREQILVLQFERSVQSPEEELARTYRFMGVDDRFRPQNYRDPVKQGRYAITKPDADERRRLAAYFQEDVQRVFSLCPELDPALWPDFSTTAADR